MIYKWTRSPQTITARQELSIQAARTKSESHRVLKTGLKTFSKTTYSPNIHFIFSFLSLMWLLYPLCIASRPMSAGFLRPISRSGLDNCKMERWMDEPIIKLFIFTFLFSKRLVTVWKYRRFTEQLGRRIPKHHLVCQTPPKGWRWGNTTTCHPWNVAHPQVDPQR